MTSTIGGLLSNWVAQRVFSGLAWSVAWRCAGPWVHLNPAAMHLMAEPRHRLPLDDWWGRLALPDGKPVAHPGPQAGRTGLLSTPGKVLRLRLLRGDGSSVEVIGRSCVTRLFRDQPGEAVLLEEVSSAIEAQETRWLASLAHEARGALQSLSLSTNLAQCAETPEVAERYLRMVKHHADFIKRLVCDYLDAASYGELALRVRPISLASLLSMYDWAETLGPRHRLVASDAGDLVVSADPDRLVQILTNLLVNARKYARPGPVVLGLRRAGPRVLLSVRDEGPGINDVDQERIFIRSARLSHAQTGRGLGLWVSRELARQMGGDLWVSSSSPGSTTFYLSIPYAPKEPALGPPVRAQVQKQKIPQGFPRGNEVELDGIEPSTS